MGKVNRRCVREGNDRVKERKERKKGKREVYVVKCIRNVEPHCVRARKERKESEKRENMGWY